MKRKFFQMSIELTNRQWSSKLLKQFTKSKLSKPFIPMFIKTYKINHEEALLPYKEHGSLHSFFTRQIEMKNRPINQEEKSVVSPVDGRCEETGEIKQDATFIVKGQHYRLEDMLQSKDQAEKFEGGTYVILYLSPSDYHRIHSPLNCRLSASKTLGSRSYPVNEPGLKYGRKPLSHNYRIVNDLYQGTIQCAMIEVGAMNINSIVRTKAGSLWEKGEEVGYFSFGSTVILLFEKDVFSLALHDKNVKVGEKIGTLQAKSSQPLVKTNVR
ncbi:MULTISPECIES: phosphatidylserine decarboxylase [Bacillaceae]|uniref:phosphatidylserine decarboxylase n=1 Tax=Bacillaceae TaxID=186817 RepID=UPI000C0730DD|nr:MULTISPECIES: phosphatidylserine decarboxylase [Bacillaceae]